VIGFLARRACRAHREALIEFASHRAGGPEVRRALDHVDRCRRCEAELATTTLVLHALRRLHEDTRRAEPAPDGWARLRSRLASTRREPSLLMTCLPGAAIALGLVIAVGDPLAMQGSRAIYDDGPAAIQRALSADDVPRVQAAADEASARPVVPFTWRRQDLPRPSETTGRPRARDVVTKNGVEPAAVEPTGVPEDDQPMKAPATWRGPCRTPRIDAERAGDL
jgi:hypothetical protein